MATSHGRATVEDFFASRPVGGRPITPDEYLNATQPRLATLQAAPPSAAAHVHPQKSQFTKMASEAMNSRFSDMFKAFQYVDMDRSGTLDKNEISRALDLWNIPIEDAKLNELILSCDRDGDGHVDYKEFVDALARDTVAPAAMGKRGMQANQAICSRPSSTSTSTAPAPSTRTRSARSTCGTSRSTTTSSELIEACDHDGDGQVDYKEFVDVLARDTVTPAAMGKRDMQSLEAMGVDARRWTRQLRPRQKLRQVQARRSTPERRSRPAAHDSTGRLRSRQAADARPGADARRSAREEGVDA